MLKALFFIVWGKFLNIRTPGESRIIYCFHKSRRADGGWVCAGGNVDIHEWFSSFLTDNCEDTGQKQQEIIHKLSR